MHSSHKFPLKYTIWNLNGKKCIFVAHQKILKLSHSSVSEKNYPDAIVKYWKISVRMDKNHKTIFWHIEKTSIAINKFFIRFMLLRNVCDVIVEKLKMLFSLHLAKCHFNFFLCKSELEIECWMQVYDCIMHCWKVSFTISDSFFTLVHHHSVLVLPVINAL